MQQPWRPFDRFEFEPFELLAGSSASHDYLLSYSIEFVSLGFEPAGDYRVTDPGESALSRYCRSGDGAVLGWVSETAKGNRTLQFASILSDGTLVRSVPSPPVTPWNCCRFPIWVNFEPGSSLEDLLVVHLKSLIDLEHGCGPTVKYRASQLYEVVHYMRQLEHETLHAEGAPAEALTMPQPLATIPAVSRDLVIH